MRRLKKSGVPSRLAEHFLELIDEALGHRVVHVFARGFGKFLEELPLARCQALRRFHYDTYQLIAATVTVEIDEALALQSQDFA